MNTEKTNDNVADMERSEKSLINAEAEIKDAEATEAENVKAEVAEIPTGTAEITAKAEEIAEEAEEESVKEALDENNATDSDNEESFSDTVFITPDEDTLIRSEDTPELPEADLESEDDDEEVTDEESEESEESFDYGEEIISEEPQVIDDGSDNMRSRPIDWLFDLVELIIFSLAAVLIVTTFIFRHTIVDGPSMEQTLYDKEHLIISNLFYTPDYGDIVVCEDYTTSLKKPIIKRVIALPGDHIEISLDGVVKVNGNIIEEEYVYLSYPNFYREEKPIDLVVPDGEIFIMGDHRDDSSDSRKSDVGTVKIDSILGRVVLRFYPFA